MLYNVMINPLPSSSQDLPRVLEVFEGEIGATANKKFLGFLVKTIMSS